MGEWCENKEPISLLTSLQANPTTIPPEQLTNLARLSGLPAADVASLIYQVRRAQTTPRARTVSCLARQHEPYHHEARASRFVAAR